MDSLGTDAQGRYFRNKGWKRASGNGKPTQHKFRLGRKEAEARKRADQLELLWSAVEARWRKLKEQGRTVDPGPLWDETTLQIGLAISQGKESCALLPPPGMDEAEPRTLLDWLNGLTRDFPILPLRLADECQPKLIAVREQLELDAEYVDGYASRLQDIADVAKASADYNRRKAGIPTRNTATLRKALDAYADAMKQQYTGPDGLTDYGSLLGRVVTSLKEHLGPLLDTPLDKVDTQFIDTWKALWANRPITARYSKPCSVEWAQKAIKIINSFIRWLNRSSFDWTKPANYEVLPCRIKESDEEVADTKRKRYKRAELVTLWRYASPMERVLMILSLNCGFGNAECTTLRIEEIDFGRKTIKRNRRKTKTPAYWQLWPETIEALRYYLDKVRPASEARYVFISKQGKPFRERTKGGFRSQHIPNFWQRLYQRILKDQPDFIKLSFNKLRKTGSNWIRAKYGVELAKLYLAHGKKDIVDAYTDPAFKLMNRAVRRYRKVLKPMFGAVEAPFPDECRKSNPSLSLNKQAKIKAMRKAGYKVSYIKATLGVSYDTVRRYSK